VDPLDFYRESPVKVYGESLTLDHKKAVFLRKNELLEQNRLLVAQKILSTPSSKGGGEIQNRSFAELLKEDYSKKNFHAKQRKMQEILDITARIYPKTHARDMEKSKLTEGSRSLLESFTGDHKLNSFVNEKLPKTEKTKLKLADYLVKTTNAQAPRKSILQEQPLQPML
jgi:hypothetical protein